MESRAISNERFYIFDRENALVDGYGNNILQEKMFPFIQTLDNNRLSWAIVSFNKTKREDDNFYSNFQLYHTGGWPPVYIQSNETDAALFDHVVSGKNIYLIEGQDKRTDINADKAKTILKACIKNAANIAENKLDTIKINETDKFNLSDDSIITLQFGKTSIDFKLWDFVEALQTIEKNKDRYRLFSIFMALDAAQLKLDMTDELKQFGIMEIRTPGDYQKIAASNIVVLDNNKDLCVKLKEVGFNAIHADTPLERELDHCDTENNYVNELITSLPPRIVDSYYENAGIDIITADDKNKIQPELLRYRNYLALEERKQYQAIAITALQEAIKISKKLDEKSLYRKIIRDIKEISLTNYLFTPEDYNSELHTLLSKCPLALTQFNIKAWERPSDELRIIRDKRKALETIYDFLKEDKASVKEFRKALNDAAPILQMRRDGFIAKLNKLLEKLGFGKDFIKTTMGVTGAKVTKNIHTHFGQRGEPKPEENAPKSKKSSDFSKKS